MGNVSCKLELPSTSQVHPVFHVSLLRSTLPSVSKVCTKVLGPEMPHTRPSSTWSCTTKDIHHARCGIHSSSPRQVLHTAGVAGDLGRFFCGANRFPRATTWGQDVSKGESRCPPSTTLTIGPAQEEGPSVARSPTGGWPIYLASVTEWYIGCGLCVWEGVRYGLACICSPILFFYRLNPSSLPSWSPIPSPKYSCELVKSSFIDRGTQQGSRVVSPWPLQIKSYFLQLMCLIKRLSVS